MRSCGQFSIIGAHGWIALLRSKVSASGNDVLLDSITVGQRFVFWFQLYRKDLEYQLPLIIACVCIFMFCEWGRGRGQPWVSELRSQPVFLRQSSSQSLALAARVRLAGTWAPGVFPGTSLALKLQAWTNMPAFLFRFQDVTQVLILIWQELGRITYPLQPSAAVI